jgi:hypothetical protein
MCIFYAICRNYDKVSIKLKPFFDYERRVSIYTQFTMTTIQNSLMFIFEAENIRSRTDLHRWCGVTRLNKLYRYIARLSPEHYARLQQPNSTIRAFMQPLLTGYRRSRHH